MNTSVPRPCNQPVKISLSVQVARWDDEEARPYEAVATGATGVYLLSQPLPLEVDELRFKDCAYGVDGDVIDCEDQTLGEVVGVVGTPYTLHYQSERTPGGRVIEFALSDEEVPGNLDAYEVTARVAGREIVRRFDPAPDLRVLFAWDGKDEAGEVVLGAQFASVEVAEIYEAGGGDYRWNLRVWGGTLGGWDTRAHGLGGWSFNVHHFFDPIDRILYLGSGGQRSGAELGAVQEAGDEVLIAAENGIAVYVFDRDDGRHLRTVNALTGAVIYQFTYDGDLLQSIDNGGQVTTINASDISGPFGEKTSFAPDRDQFWTSISNPASSMSFTYSAFETEFDLATRVDPMADGLLQNLEDPNGGEWAYSYDARGRLQNQDDADQGSIGVDRSPLAAEPEEVDQIEEAYSINLETAGGTMFSHEVKEFEDGSVERKITADGEVTELTTGPDLSENGTLPWDATFSRVRRPGERHKLVAGLPARLGDLNADYSVERADPRQLLAADGFTQKTTWNDATSTTAGDGATITTTTPGGRTVETITDAVGRPEAMRLPGLPAISIEYDQGRPTKISQGGRSVSLGYSGAFVSEITDPLGRTVNIPRVGDGRVDNQDVYGIEQFDYGYDDNGNLTGTTSPQSGGYSESTTYSPVDLVESFNLPAGQTTVSYNLDREPTDGTSPQGALDFDGEGRLTDVGPIHYTYDDDDYVTQISSPDGTIDYGYEGKPVPTSITWAGSVNGTVEIGRNGRFQATSIGVAGGPSVNVTVDPDGVVSAVGALAIERNAATFITGTSVGNIHDTYERNALGEPTRYTATHDTAGELFSEEYVRDRGGRIQAKTVRIRNPTTGVLETYTVRYGYDAPGRLQTVTYNDDPPIHYDYDANNNLIGEPAQAPVPTPGPQRLFLHAAAPAATPGAVSGSWTDTAAAELAAMALDREGSPTATTVTATNCDAGSGEPRRLLATTFVSPPLSDPHLFSGNERLQLVVGAGESDSGDALQAVARVWLMDGANGTERCTVAEDWQIGEGTLPSPDAMGIEGHAEPVPATAPDSCVGTTAAAGDRLVVEVGFACTNATATSIEGNLWRGGAGPALSDGGNPEQGACGRPGYLQVEGGLEFTGTADPSPCDPATTIPVPSRRLYSVTVNAQNQATDAHLLDPQGIERRYHYTYDENGALESKTEMDAQGVQIPNTTVTYDYDVFGNLRHVDLADGRKIDYLIDASNRRVGRILKNAQDVTLSVRKYLYQSGLRPIAELDENDNVVSFFVYGDKVNVPEYMVRGGVTYRIVTDQLGSVRMVVNVANGEIVQRMNYDEHGNAFDEYIATGWPPAIFGYAGGLYERDTSLCRFGTRDYLLELSRWTARDSIGFGGRGVNLYTYSGNDSTNFVDPNGKIFWLPVTAAILAYTLIADPANAPGPNEPLLPPLDEWKRLAAGAAAYFGVGALSGAFEDSDEPKQSLKYHYTCDPESDFENGLLRETHVTDDPNLTPEDAIWKLGCTRRPDKIIPVIDKGDFVPASPPKVYPHERGAGGGSDFYNPNRVPPDQILPALPIRTIQ